MWSSCNPEPTATAPAPCLAPSPWVVAAAFVLGGTAFGLIDSGLNAFAAGHFDAREINWMHASYGLGAVATDPNAVERIYEAKGRPSVNPLIVHVAGIAQARDCVSEWPDDAQTLASLFWPGPLTLVLSRSAQIPDVVTAGKPTVGLRHPAGKVAGGLIQRCGRPLAAPSANRSNRLSPTRAEHVLAAVEGQPV